MNMSSPEDAAAKGIHKSVKVVSNSHSEVVPSRPLILIVHERTWNLLTYVGERAMHFVNSGLTAWKRNCRISLTSKRTRDGKLALQLHAGDAQTGKLELPPTVYSSCDEIQLVRCVIVHATVWAWDYFQSMWFRLRIWDQNCMSYVMQSHVISNHVGDAIGNMFDVLV